jgi:hypothetical protein
LPQRQPSERLIVWIYCRRSTLARGAAGIGADFRRSWANSQGGQGRLDRREPAIHIRAAFVDSCAASRWDVAQSGGSVFATLPTNASSRLPMRATPHFENSDVLQCWTSTLALPLKDRSRLFGCLVRSLASHRCTGEEVLLDDGVDAPVAIDHLGYAEVDSDRDERNRLVLGQSFGFHEERAHLAESVF